MGKVILETLALGRLNVENLHTSEAKKTEGSAPVRFDVTMERVDADSEGIDVTYAAALNADERFSIYMELRGRFRVQPPQTESPPQSALIEASYGVFARASMLISSIVESLGITPIILSPAVFRKALSENEGKKTDATNG